MLVKVQILVMKPTLSRSSYNRKDVYESDVITQINPPDLGDVKIMKQGSVFDFVALHHQILH